MTDTSLSRRSVLGSVPAGRITALTTTGLRCPLVLDYKPSQPHGWGAGSTIGGHVGSRPFLRDGRWYRVSLLAPDPIYEDLPTDLDIRFGQVLDETFGDHYTFRYVGLRGARKLRVQSYSAYASEAGVGADLYVVYEPDRRRGDPAIHDDLHWIQVVKSHGPPLDNTWRANPFHATGGLTSINGNAICNFYDRPLHRGAVGPSPDGLPRFTAETFLARDTGVKEAGKEVVTILGGLEWGWHVEELSLP